jgi:hypothetical protein
VPLMSRRLTTMFYLREIPMFMKHAQEHGGGIGGMLAGGKEMLLSKMLFEPFMSRGTTAAISASRSLTPMPQATGRSSRRYGTSSVSNCRRCRSPARSGQKNRWV